MFRINKVIALLALVASNGASAESPLLQCRGAQGCGDCITNGCAWANGECFDSCSQIADVSCYSQAFNVNLNSGQICELATQEAGDIDACSAKTDCAGCTSTKVSYGGNCYWHPEVAACKPLVSDAWTTGVTADHCLGEGEDLCRQGGQDCYSCLGNGCAWAGGSCERDCSIIADASCFTDTSFPFIGVTKICEIASEIEFNQAICGPLTTCESCTSTKKMNGSSCEWYTLASGQVWCGTGGGDMDGNVGSKTCGWQRPFLQFLDTFKFFPYNDFLEMSPVH